MRIVKLGEIAKVDRDLVKPQHIENGTNYIGLEHISSEGKFLDIVKVHHGELNSSKFRFNQAHILYGKLRPYLNKIATPNFFGICSTDILPLLPKNNLIDKRYLFYYLRQQHMIDLATARCTGANLPRLSPKRLLEFDILLPPLREQRRIAAILDKADELRTKRKAALDKLDALLESIFLDMFGDPVTNPKGWQVTQISDVIKLKGGYAFKSKNYADEGIPLVRIGEVNREDFDSGGVVYVPFAYKRKLERFLVKNGTILMSLTGTTGKDDYGNVVLLNGSQPEYFINQRVAAITPVTKDIINLYLYYYLKNVSIKRQLTGKSRGIRQANISNTDIKRLKITRPPVEKQKAFESFVNNIKSQQSRYDLSNKSLHNLFHSLQQRAFRGEL